MAAIMSSMRTVPEQFVELCKSLYGDVVDPAVIWHEVTKISPDQADLHAQRAVSDQRKRKVTAGLSAVGAGAGALGLAVGAKEVARHGWKGTPRLTRALVPAEVAGLGGELMATKILHGDTRKKKLVPTGQVSKARDLFGPLKPVVQGLRRAWNPTTAAAAGARPAVASTPKAAPPIRGVDLGAQMKAGATRPTTRAEAKAAHAAGQVQAGQDRAYQHGQDIGNFLKTPAGKATAVGAGAVGLYATGKTVAGRRRRNAEAAYYGGYGKSATYDDVTFEGTFSKLDTDKQLAFGWASVTKLNGVPVVDKQGDYIDLDDLEDAAYTYVRKSRVGGDMHRRSMWVDSPHQVSDLVESFVVTDDKVKAMKLPDDTPRGWWVGFKVHDPTAWEMVKKGERRGFSIHGRGLRKAADLDELMGVG